MGLVYSNPYISESDGGWHPLLEPPVFKADLSHIAPDELEVLDHGEIFFQFFLDQLVNNLGWIKKLKTHLAIEFEVGQLDIIGVEICII